MILPQTGGGRNPLSILCCTNKPSVASPSPRLQFHPRGVFSTADDVVTALRTNLKPSNVDMLVFLNKHFKLYFMTSFEMMVI